MVNFLIMAHKKHPSVDLSISELLKDKKFRLFFFQNEYRNKLYDEYQNHVTIFTDGSKDENGLGCAVVVHEKNLAKRVSLNIACGISRYLPCTPYY